MYWFCFWGWDCRGIIAPPALKFGWLPKDAEREARNLAPISGARDLTPTVTYITCIWTGYFVSLHSVSLKPTHNFDAQAKYAARILLPFPCSIDRG